MVPWANPLATTVMEKRVAKLIYDEIGAVRIAAKDGEELPNELVAAWGQAESARQLENIAHYLQQMADDYSRKSR